MPHYKTGVGYTILNSFYFYALHSLADELERENISHTFVGGAAFQLRIADVLGWQGVADIKGIGGLDVLLRPTGDIDLATISDSAQMSYFFNMLTHQSPFNAEPRGSKLISLTKKGTKGKSSDSNDVVQVNLYMGAPDFRGLTDHYEAHITTADTAVVRKGNERLDARVPTLSYCLATKLIRGAEKDKVDISNLLNACHARNILFDSALEETRAILKSVGKEDRFEYIRDIAYELTMPRAPVSLTGNEA